MSKCRNRSVTGNSTWARFVQLFKKGPVVLCSSFATPVYMDQTNDDDKGGRITKDMDTAIHDQTTERSKYTKGPGWQRGF